MSKLKAPIQRVSTAAKKRRPSLNTLPPTTTKRINDAVSKFMGVDGLLSVPNSSLTAAEQVLKTSFWSKFTSPGYSSITGKSDNPPEVRKARAIEKWLASEQRNLVTNNRLIFRDCDFGFATSGRILKLMRKYISETIGYRPPPYLLGEYTGGASTRVRRSPTAIAEKFEGKAHASASSIPYHAALKFELPGWGIHGGTDCSYHQEEESVLFTVPKNAETDRAACKEPEVNVYLQRAVGLFFRRRLKRFGIDTQEQGNNRSLAREGSRTRKYATIDLSSASDSVSTSLIKLVLPSLWFQHLDDVRIKATQVNGVHHSLQMFSSMGNGFTFELETLIFWSLARSVATLIRSRGRLLVYGDDIVCRTDIARCLKRVLPWFGFTMNLKKSFISGPFRESCGGFYYNGSDVSPVFLKKRITTKTELVQLGNQLTEWTLTVPLGVMSRWVVCLIGVLRSETPSWLAGGQSCERSDALVTGDSPRRRLVQVSEPLDVPQLGAYLWWHHDKADELVKAHPPIGMILNDHNGPRPDPKWRIRPHLQFLNCGVSRVHSPTEAAREGRWVKRPNRSWYDRQLMVRVNHELNPAIALYNAVSGT